MTEQSKEQTRIPNRPFHLDLPPVETGGCSILMLGSGRSGKTTALKYVIDKYFKNHLGIIYSQSAKAFAYSHMNYPLLPLSSVFIPEVMNDCYHINKETKNHYPFLFVLDDCPLAKNDKELLKLLTIYRNSGISGVVCIQSPTLLNPTCRANFTFVCLMKQNSTEQVEQTVKGWLRGYFPKGWNMEQKIDWYRRATADHYFILIDNWSGTISRCKIDLS